MLKYKKKFIFLLNFTKSFHVMSFHWFYRYMLMLGRSVSPFLISLSTTSRLTV